MKKIGKILLVSTLAILTVGTIKVVNINSETLLKGNVSGHVQAYNHNPNNILDNVYKDDSYGLVLPFIFDGNGQTIEKQYVEKQFNKMGLTPVFSKDVIGTGTTISVKENSNKYSIIVFGDTNGDGKVNLIDAQKIVLHNKDKSKALTGLYFIAGNVSNNDNVINLIDAQRVVMLQKGLTNKLVVNEPASMKEVDKTAPDIKLKGNSEITLIVKDTYTEQGATATDNVDGDVTNNIKVKIQKDGKTVDKVDTSKLGTYVITYTVTDEAGNTASKTRKVIIKDVIDSIEMLASPNKIVYNYGENIELTGAKFKANYLSGNVEDNIDITKASVTGYDSKTEGQQEIIVTYKEKQTSFTVTVLKKIAGLELIETGRDNVTIEDESDVYKTISKEQFVLGTIKEIEQEEGSKLQASQVQFVTKMQITSSNSNTAEFEETDKLILSVNENNQIIGTAQEAGSYQIEAYIMYGTEKVSLSINLNAVKSTVIGELVFIGPEDDEVRYNNEEPVQKELKVKNINGEEIGILAKDVIITNNSDKITVTKLNANKSEISEENEQDTEICYLEITTNSKVAIDGVSFKIEIANTDISKDVTFDLGEALGITSIKVTKVQEDGQTEVETTSVALGNEIGETILPVYFYNQLDNQMQVKAMDVQVVNNQWLQNNTKEDGKLYIVIPDVQIQKIIGGLPVSTQGIAIKAKLYDENGIEANANDNVAKIGFSLINNEEQRVILSSLTDKNIEFVSTGLNESYKLSMDVSFNSVTELNFSDEVKENIEVSDDGDDYFVVQGNEFILGSISVPLNEQLKEDMLEAKVINGDTSGVSISFENKEDGTVLVKGTATKVGVYGIIINLKDSNDENMAIEIHITVQEPTNTTITDIQIGQDYVIGNNVTTTTINALSNSTQLQIKRKDIEIKHNDSNTEITNKTIVIEEPENVEIQLLNDKEDPLVTSEGHEDEIVTKISIEYIGTVTENTSKTINIVLYNNENQTPITKTLKVYTSDIKSIDVASEVTLNKKVSDGEELNKEDYSLVAIKGYLDENKTIETDLKLSDFQENGKIKVEPDLIKIKLEGQFEIDSDLISVQYFDSNKNVINSKETNEEVAYIGFAIRPHIFNAEDLDGANITITCITLESPITITINYTEN